VAAAIAPDPRARPIGVFDSGVGGLTVLHELLVSLPHEDFVYLGDTARFPYGEKSAEQLSAFSRENADVLLGQGAKLIVVACNSATSAALGELEDHLARAHRGIDAVGVVGPESSAAVAQTASGRIGLLATPATVASGAYERAVKSADRLVELTSVACPDLAPLIQAGFPFDQGVVDTVRTYCAPLREARVDTVILGCTHYPLVRPVLQRALGPDVSFVTSGDSVARRVQHALGVRELANPRRDEGDYRFLATGDVKAFRELGTRFLQMPLGEVAHVDVAPIEAIA
jgi:glutamate racemase